MAALLGIQRKKTAVIEFLFLEGESAANIHKRLVNIYGKSALDVSAISR